MGMVAAGATNLRVPTKGLAKELKTESMKTGIPMKEVNGQVLRCQQKLEKFVGKSVMMGGLLKGCEALALVDERLAGEGTGLAFGVNDPSLGFAWWGRPLYFPRFLRCARPVGARRRPRSLGRLVIHAKPCGS